MSGGVVEMDRKISIKAGTEEDKFKDGDTRRQQRHRQITNIQEEVKRARELMESNWTNPIQTRKPN